MERINRNLEKNGLIIKKQEFDSYQETEKLIRYITRTRKCDGEDNVCIAYGGHGVSISRSVEEAIRQFNMVFSVYEPPRKGCNRHVFHEFYKIRDEYARVLSYEEMDELAYRLSGLYWDLGFQVIYGVHRPDKESGYYHIHFAVNTVSKDRNIKWSPNGRDNQKRSRAFERITEEFVKERNMAGDQ